MTQPKLTDQCFDIRYEQGVHAAEFTQDAPEDLCEYVNSYLSKVSKYRNMTPERPYATYSLYQPPLATAAGKRSLLMRLRRKYERVRIPATVTVGDPDCLSNDATTLRVRVESVGSDRTAENYTIEVSGSF